MGEVGPRWDVELFERFRVMRGTAEEGRLLEQLVRANEGLVRTLADELRDDPRCAGAERLERQELHNIGRLAFLRAVRDLDPAKCGTKPAKFIKWRMLHEVQKAVALDAAVIRGQRQRPPEVTYFEADDEAGVSLTQEVRCQVTRRMTGQVKGRIYVSDADKRRIERELEGLVSMSRIQRFLGGDPSVHPNARKAILRAMEKLHIAGPQRRTTAKCESGTLEAAEPVAEPIPQSA